MKTRYVNSHGWAWIVSLVVANSHPMSSNGRCVTRNNWANITTWAPLSTMEVRGGWWWCFRYKTCIWELLILVGDSSRDLDLSPIVGGHLTFPKGSRFHHPERVTKKCQVERFLLTVLAKLWFFVRGNCRSGTGALYIGDMTNGRLIRWPIGAKQGEKPKLNFHGWSSYPPLTSCLRKETNEFS